MTLREMEMILLSLDLQAIESSMILFCPIRSSLIYIASTAHVMDGESVMSCPILFAYCNMVTLDEQQLELSVQQDHMRVTHDRNVLSVTTAAYIRSVSLSSILVQINWVDWLRTGPHLKYQGASQMSRRIEYGLLVDCIDLYKK